MTKAEKTLPVGTAYFEGKIINCLGDSITQGVGNDNHSWVSMLEELLPVKKINNYGISGTTVSLFPEKGKEFVSRFRDMDKDADVIIVFGGINDFNHSLPLGTMESEGEDSFYGAVKTIVRGLLEQYPLADIMFITPMKAFGFKDYPHWNTLNADGHRLVDYRNAILEVCNYYSIPVLDLFSQSNLTPDIPACKEKLLCDGLHPSRLGYERMTRKIYNFLVNTL
ncbi:MAG: SGNH/GDSL hydrolase family protein [bacterium]|nr:SGNH/GDSL hydrolase family protein [bacterium]